MKKGFMPRLYSIIQKSNVLFEVLDARFPELTRNKGIEEKILARNKKLVFVVNKSDLVTKESLLKEKKRLSKIAQTVFLSAKEKTGTGKLREALGKATSHKESVIGIIGYPNTGKSSVINVLRGKAVARTAPKAGFTRGEQFVRLSDKIMLIDSPGIIPFEQHNEFELALINAKNAEQLKDVEAVAFELIPWLLQKNSNSLKETFGISEREPEKVLEAIALKKKKLLKGAVPDSQTAAKLLIQAWQKGILRV